jgi:hypothetical protein
MAKKKLDQVDDRTSLPATPTKRRTTKRQTATLQAAPQPTYEQIAEAAYHRYLERGGQHGQDFDDWVEAERTLRLRSR